MAAGENKNYFDMVLLISHKNNSYKWSWH